MSVKLFRSTKTQPESQWIKTVVAVFVLAAVSGCGTGENDLDAGDDSSATITASQDEDSTDEGDAVNRWIRITTDPDIERYQPTNPVEVVAHPNDEQVLLVRFNMSQPPCSGARAQVTESDEMVSVLLEIGIHKNVAAMSCLAGDGEFELEAELDAPLGNRVITTEPSNDSTTSDTTPSTTTSDGSTSDSSTSDGIVSSEDTSTTAAPVDKPSTTGSADADLKIYVGLTIEEASARAIDRGVTIRVIRLDGEDLIGTMDYRTDRVNVEVIDGVVVGVPTIG